MPGPQETARVPVGMPVRTVRIQGAKNLKIGGLACPWPFCNGQSVFDVAAPVELAQAATRG
jgi:hypothetical protein